MYKNLVKTNIIFIFIFLNFWDFVVNRSFFNAMTLGILMFGPSIFLWFLGTVRAAALVTLVSIFEFIMLSVFILEGFELGGASITVKSVFWLPYLLLAAFNGFFGLKIYTQYRQQKIRQEAKGKKKKMIQEEQTV